MHSLPLFVRLSGRPVILLGQGDAAGAKRRLLERAGATIVGEAEQAALAIVAIDEDDEAQAAITRLKARGILVNAVDRAAECDFTLPAIIDRDPVLIAIGTGGASAGLAKALRQRLETLLPQSLGPVATALQQARSALRARWPGAAERRRAIDAAFEAGCPLDPFIHHPPNAVDLWLSHADASKLPKSQSFVVTSDDPDDLTLGAARALGQADQIIYARGISDAIVARGRADAVRVEGDAFPAPLPDGLTVLLRRG
jgi:uroporphyrin-III C-methyltransferase / precorrin-2 dehydrogenase / sirohydrochlorin ferrochelatase